MDVATKPIAVSIPKAKEITSLGKTKLYELINDGSLESVVVGGRRLVLVRSIERLFFQEV